MGKKLQRFKGMLRKVNVFDGEKVREDFRKLGTTFIPAGLIAMILPPASVNPLMGFIILIIGVVAWLVGVRKTTKEDN
jgi:hypothetical protein